MKKSAIDAIDKRFAFATARLKELDARIGEIRQILCEPMLITKQERPDLNHDARAKLGKQRNAEWRASLADRQKMLMEEKESAEREWHDLHKKTFNERRDAQRAAWPGIGVVARCVENRLKKAGETYIRSGYQGDSQYFYVGDATIRVSDHEQPAYGAFAGYTDDDEVRYHPGPDIDITPFSGVSYEDVIMMLHNLED